MFAGSRYSRGKRRGIILVVVLGMLGLLALIGVTFATFSSQAQINARNFAQSATFPDAVELMDYALTQLIEDTGNPASVIRGHSVKRDMYGNDAARNGFLAATPDGNPLTVVNAVAGTGLYAGTIRLTVSIPSSNNVAGGGAFFYGYDFNRWMLKFPAAIDQSNSAAFVSRTHEVIHDEPAGDGTNRYLYIPVPTDDIYKAPILASATKAPMRLPADPFVAGYQTPDLPGFGVTTWTSRLTILPGTKGYPDTNSFTGLTAAATRFVLDGRFLHGFNGPGVSGMNVLGYDTALLANAPGSTTPYPTPMPLTEYANFRYNGNIFTNVVTGSQNASAVPTYSPGYGDPNNSGFIPGMDEDYDACDLENWFLAIQSADGQVVIPSFHRPGIVSQLDWGRGYDPNKFSTLTPNQQLGVTRAMSRTLRPRRIDGHSPVSFPDLVPDSTGKLNYDVDNDGDGQTDSVWLDLGYTPKRAPGGQLFKPLFSFMVIGLNGRLPLNTAGNIQKRDPTMGLLTDHAEHLGNSPSEIDLKFALQNAWDPNFDPTTTAPPYQQYDNATDASGNLIYTDPSTTPPTSYIRQVPVALTQLRNLLTGTRLPDPSFNPNQPYSSSTNTPTSNFDINTLVVNGTRVLLPNNVADGSDVMTPPPSATGPGKVLRTTPAVAGRWGEEDAVPGSAQNPLILNTAGPQPPTNFNNAIRAGHSISNSSYDARDDNLNGFDFNGEGIDRYDGAGLPSLPVERIRRFHNPIDVDGTGVVLTYGAVDDKNAFAPHSQGGNLQKGGDQFGRVSFFHYFRPAGIPIATNGVNRLNGPNPAAVLYDPSTANYPTVYHSDARTNNIFHGFIEAMTPNPGFNFDDTRTPKWQPNTATNSVILSATPSDPPPPSNPTGPTGNVVPLTNPLTTPPTYPVNSNDVQKYGQINSYAFGGAGLAAMNEADEMNLFAPSRLDAPFGPSDLEWLYRFQDVDGASLQSRLGYLAPISFLNPKDGSRRRRLFALDSWEPTSFVWANDNPQGMFASNSRFKPVSNAGFQSLGLNNVVNTTTNAVTVQATGPVNSNTILLPDPAFDFSVVANSTTSPTTRNQYPAQTPAIAHRERRVNLNFPLPVLNDPIEPVRQKWIRETYQLLKAILPPRAVDTPEELAQLSQYVVNIIDFRDPDCTTTKFVNTDVLVNEPSSTTTQATLAFSNSLPPDIAYNPTYVIPTPAPNATSMPPHYLVQYGMEYQPVAINEVLAYQFQTKNVSPPKDPKNGDVQNDTARMLVEIVNVLTKDALPDTLTTPDSSDLDMGGWDFVVLPDDGYGRPDPFTGQIPAVQPGMYLDPVTGAPVYAVPATGGSVANDFATSVLPSPTVVNPLVSALSGYNQVDTANNVRADVTTSTNSIYYYVFGNKAATQAAAALPAEMGNERPDFTPAGTTAVNQTVPNPSYPPKTVGFVPPPSGTSTEGYVDLTGLLHQRLAAPKQAKAGDPAPAPEPGYYYWLYLRRPANPFDPTSDKVVVDSFRFVFTKSSGIGTQNATTGADFVADSPGSTTKYDDLRAYQFSLERLQPLRGGHAVPPLTTTGTQTLFIPAYGYSEQTTDSTGIDPIANNTAKPYYTQGQYGALPSTGQIKNTIGAPNSANDLSRPGQVQGSWDYFPFNDRDFTSVVELTLVPAVGPGLFTKQFSELAPPLPLPSSYQPLKALAYPVAATMTGPNTTPGPLDDKIVTYANSPWVYNTPVDARMLYPGNGRGHTFPYLNDEFFYTGSGEPPVAVSTNPNSGWVAGEPTPPAVGGTWTNAPPYRATNPDQTGAYHYVGGPASAGWFKMFDFFDVPSPAFGAIGPVDSGTNYDWARQDLKHGLLNLNLIIDEEVFLGLMGESLYRQMNQGQIGMPGSTTFAGATTPSVVTMVNDDNTIPANGSYHMPNVGIYDNNGFVDPIDGKTYGYQLGQGLGNVQSANGLMKACFADFLSLRHGANGNLFTFVNERPFHSLSYPDINYTVMRPAALPPASPAPVTTNPTTMVTGYPWASQVHLPAPAPNTFAVTWDPGIKNPFLFNGVTNNPTTPNPYQPPPVPPRRLFEIPDAFGSPALSTTANGKPFGLDPNAAGNPVPSNASLSGDPNINIFLPLTTGLSMINSGTAAVWSKYVVTPAVTGLFPDLTNVQAPTGGIDPTTNMPKYTPGDVGRSPWLGGNSGANPTYDQTDHPYFRSEWLQKVTNLTTVRTHQYAVWITVGFFEVTKAGDTNLANLNPPRPDLAYDQLGLEIGKLEGKNVRYRGFFLIDRTRATGFDPYQPGDFRDCVVHRQLIE